MWGLTVMEVMVRSWGQFAPSSWTMWLFKLSGLQEDGVLKKIFRSLERNVWLGYWIIPLLWNGMHYILNLSSSFIQLNMYMGTWIIFINFCLASVKARTKLGGGLYPWYLNALLLGFPKRWLLKTSMRDFLDMIKKHLICLLEAALVRRILVINVENIS